MSEADKVVEKLKKGAEEFAKKTEKAVKVLETFSPKAARGLMLVAVTIPSIYLIGAATAAIAPYVWVYIQAAAPLIIYMLTMFMALSIASLAIYVVRTFVLG
jgi:hypothetical protein